MCHNWCMPKVWWTYLWNLNFYSICIMQDILRFQEKGSWHKILFWLFQWHLHLLLIVIEQEIFCFGVLNGSNIQRAHFFLFLVKISSAFHRYASVALIVIPLNVPLSFEFAMKASEKLVYLRLTLPSLSYPICLMFCFLVLVPVFIEKKIF